MNAVPLAHIRRSGFVETVHLGHAVIIDPNGVVMQSWGNPDEVIFPRSSNKIAQAAGFIALGLELPPNLRALTAASHSGEAIHLAGALEILSGAGLTVDDLQTPADLPYGRDARTAWIAAGKAPEPLAMNCSGKHAGMLATAKLNGFDLVTYREVAHPVQRAGIDQLKRLSGSDASIIGTDGCGAPVVAMTVTQLAQMFSRSVQLPSDDPARQVADAMRAHPQMVGGADRDVTELMQGVPGLLAKDGAEGVYVAALESGYAVAFKILDGADRARSVVMAQALALLGATDAVLATQRSVVVLGGGKPVGELVGVLA